MVSLSSGTQKQEMNQDIREWRNFKNGARNDGLELGHWAKASVDSAAGTFAMLYDIDGISCQIVFSEYPFVKYDVHSTAYTYSQDEYTRFLEGRHTRA